MEMEMDPDKKRAIGLMFNGTRRFLTQGELKTLAQQRLSGSSFSILKKMEDGEIASEAEALLVAKDISGGKGWHNQTQAIYEDQIMSGVKDYRAIEKAQKKIEESGCVCYSNYCSECNAAPFALKKVGGRSLKPKEDCGCSN